MPYYKQLSPIVHFYINIPILRGWKVHGENAPEICHSILHRLEWMPSYQEWKKHLLPQLVRNNQTYYTPHIMKTPNFDSHNQSVMFEKVDEKGHDVVSHENISHYPMIVPTRMWGTSNQLQICPCLLVLTNRYASTYFTQMYGFSQDLAHTQLIQRLYKYGPSFLYGMLFHQSFHFTNQLLESVKDDLHPTMLLLDNDDNDEDENDEDENEEDSVFSIAIHSRHE